MINILQTGDKGFELRSHRNIQIEILWQDVEVFSYLKVFEERLSLSVSVEERQAEEPDTVRCAQVLYALNTYEVRLTRQVLHLL